MSEKANRLLKECRANCHFYLFDKVIKCGTILYFSDEYDAGPTVISTTYYEYMVFGENLSKLGTVPKLVFLEIEPFLDFADKKILKSNEYSEAKMIEMSIKWFDNIESQCDRITTESFSHRIAVIKGCAKRNKEFLLKYSKT